MDAFLSYQTEDLALAERLAADLERNGVSVWVDHSKIRPGSDWAQEIERAISEARNVLFLVPEGDRASSWQSSEIALAVASQRSDPSKRIIPIVAHRGPYELPFFLSRLHAVDLSSDVAYQKALPELADLIMTESFPEVHAASDRARENLISVQLDAVRKESEELARASRAREIELPFTLVSAAVTVLIAALVIFVVFNSGWIDDLSSTTALAFGFGVVGTALVPSIQRTIKHFLFWVARRREEAG